MDKCPKCGYCPNCGRQNTPSYVPYTQPIYPWLQPSSIPGPQPYTVWNGTNGG